MTNEHPAISLFRDLLAIPSPSGFEAGLARVVRDKLTGLGYTPSGDHAGNVFVRLPGRNPQAPLVCLAAHMDEIGFVVTAIEADGVLRVDRHGGLYAWKHGEGPVEILGDHGAIPGVLSMGSTHSGPPQEAIGWDRVRVLTGLTPAQLAASGVRIGSAGVPVRDVCGPYLFGDGADPLAAAWTFDDRMGVVALLRLLEALKRDNLQPACPLIVAFTTGEEIGGLGAKVLALRERPDVFVAIDGCPTPPGTQLALDGRPGIWTKDRLTIYDPLLVRDLRQLAHSVGTELQPAVFASTASDASMVAEVGAAGRVACFGHVRENSHGYEVARLSVFDNVLKLLVAFVTQWQG